MSDKVHPNLPEAYGPASGKQNCGNCIFMYEGNLCSFWKAPVKKSYLCAKWQAQYISKITFLKPFSKVRSLISKAVEYRGEKFAGYNKPKKTPSHPKKSHAVLAKEGSTIKLIRFGQQGVSGAGGKPKTDSERARRRSFKARHAKNIKRGKLSAAYWANKVKW